MSARSGRSSTQTSEIASPDACPAGAADAVDVVLGDHRQLVVDDVRQGVDVQAAGGDVGRHEDGHLPLLKSSSARSRCGWLLSPWMAVAAMPSRSSCWASRPAPCLVRVKTSACSMRPDGSSWPSSSRLRSLVDPDDDLVDSSAAVFLGVDLDEDGFAAGSRRPAA